MEWQPLETHKEYTGPDSNPCVLVFGELCGVQMGYVYNYGGECHGRPVGFNGDWKITHWMPLPEPPK